MSDTRQSAETNLVAVSLEVIPHLHNGGEDDPEEEQIFRDLWEDETQRDVVNRKP
jgi:hypothetical protein